MKRQVQIITLRFVLAALAPGEWFFWRFATWRSRLQTKLENLKDAHDELP